MIIGTEINIFICDMIDVRMIKIYISMPKKINLIHSKAIGIILKNRRRQNVNIIKRTICIKTNGRYIYK